MFPICGLNKNEYAGKFQKWKVEVRWYEGPRENRAKVNFEDVDYAREVFRELKKTSRFQ